MYKTGRRMQPAFRGGMPVEPCSTAVRYKEPCYAAVRRCHRAEHVPGANGNAVRSAATPLAWGTVRVYTGKPVHHAPRVSLTPKFMPRGPMPTHPHDQGLAQGKLWRTVA